MCQKTKACTAAYGAATRALKAISKVRPAAPSSPSIALPHPAFWPLRFLPCVSSPGISLLQTAAGCTHLLPSSRFPPDLGFHLVSSSFHLSSLAHLSSFPLVLYSPLVPPFLRTSFEVVVVCDTWLVCWRFRRRAKGGGAKDPRERCTCLQKASVLPSVCPSARPPLSASSLGMISSSSWCCSSVKFGFGAVSLWSFSRRCHLSPGGLCGRRPSSCLSPDPVLTCVGIWLFLPPGEAEQPPTSAGSARAGAGDGRTRCPAALCCPGGFFFPFLAG